MRYYRTIAREAWGSSLEFGKRRGILFGAAAAVLGPITFGLIAGWNWRALWTAAAGPAALFVLTFLVNLLRAPSEICKRQESVIEELQGAVSGLQEEKRAMLIELTPAVAFEAGNSPEYDREMEIDVYDNSTGQGRKETRKVKLLKVVNTSAQSLVVNAEISKVIPPMFEADGPPIRLAWREGAWGNNTLPAHGFDYLIISPPIANVDLWTGTETRTVHLSAWVQGQLGATQVFRLDFLNEYDRHPWITALPY